MNKILKLSIMFLSAVAVVVAVAMFFTFGRTVSAEGEKLWKKKTLEVITEYDKIPLRSVVNVKEGDTFEIKNPGNQESARGTVLSIDNYFSSPPSWIVVKYEDYDPTKRQHYLFPKGSEITQIVESSDLLESQIRNIVKDELIDYSNTESLTALIPQSAPPEIAEAGDHYVNSSSGADCVLLCEKLPGDTTKCTWVLAYGNSGYGAYPYADVPCKAVPVESNELNIAFPNAATEYQTLEKTGENYPDAENNGFSVKFTYPLLCKIRAFLVEIGSGGEISNAKLFSEYDNDGKLYRERSIIPDFIEKGLLQLGSGKETLFRLDINAKEILLYAGALAISTLNGEIIQESIIYELYGKVENIDTLPSGLYGIVFRSIDTDHNITESVIAPVKIRIN